MDRRQVEHVEAQLGELRQLLLDALQAAPRAREQLIPGAEARALAVDLERQRLVAAEPRRGAPATRSTAAKSSGPSAASSCGLAGAAVLERPARPGSSARVVGVRARSSALREQHGALGQLAGQVVLPGRELALELVAPGREASVQASIVYCQRPSASTVNAPSQRTPSRCASTGASRHSRQRLPPGAAVAHDGAQDLVAVAEDVGRHRDGVAHAALGGIAAGVDDGSGGAG